MDEKLSFHCVTCGERMQTHTIMVPVHGCSECGDSDDEEVETYSRQDAYSIASATDEFEKLCRQPLEKLLAQQKLSLSEEIRKTISREDFGKIVLEQKLKQLESEHNENIRDLPNILGSLHFSNYAREPNYAIHAKCVAPFLQSDKTEEIRYEVNEGKKQLLRANLHVDARQIPQILNYLISQLSEFVKPDDFNVDGKFVFALDYLGN